MKAILFACSLSFCVALTACGEGVTGDPVMPPEGIGNRNLFSKADVGEAVPPQDFLSFGEPMDGEFVRDLQFDSAAIRIVADSVVTLYTTGDTRAEATDTTLFIYGPWNEERGYGDEAITWDDNSHWGGHAKIKDLRIGEAGLYLIVVGTPYANGRGHYVLMADCMTGQCAPVQPLALSAGELPESLTGEVAQAAQSCRDLVDEYGLDCVVDAHSFSYLHEGGYLEPALGMVVEDSLVAVGFSPNCAFGGELAEEDLAAILENLSAPEFLDGVREHAGSQKLVAGWGACWDYQDEWLQERMVQYHVMQLPETDVVVVLSVAVFEDLDDGEN
jgi:hypothetical protein